MLRVVLPLIGLLVEIRLVVVVVDVNIHVAVTPKFFFIRK